MPRTSESTSTWTPPIEWHARVQNACGAGTIDPCDQRPRELMFVIHRGEPFQLRLQLAQELPENVAEAAQRFVAAMEMQRVLVLAWRMLEPRHTQYEPDGHTDGTLLPCINAYVRPNDLRAFSMTDYPIAIWGLVVPRVEAAAA